MSYFIDSARAWFHTSPPSTLFTFISLLKSSPKTFFVCWSNNYLLKFNWVQKFNKIIREVNFNYSQVPHLLHLPTDVLVKFFQTKINCLLPYPSVDRIILETLQVQNK